MFFNLIFLCLFWCYSQKLFIFLLLSNTYDLFLKIFLRCSHLKIHRFITTLSFFFILILFMRVILKLYSYLFSEQLFQWHYYSLMSENYSLVILTLFRSCSFYSYVITKKIPVPPPCDSLISWPGGGELNRFSTFQIFLMEKGKSWVNIKSWVQEK